MGQEFVPLSLMVEFDQAQQLAVLAGANPDQLVVDLRRFGEDPFDLKNQIAFGGDDKSDFVFWVRQLEKALEVGEARSKEQ